MMDQRGAVTLWIPIILLSLLTVGVFFVETGRLMIARVQVQTAADAASLGGVSTAVRNTTDEIDVIINDSGEISEVSEVSNAGPIVINQNEADEEAVRLLNCNSSVQITTWQGQANEDKYSVTVQDVKIPTRIPSMLSIHPTIDAFSEAWAANKQLP